jgi:hypothetical protein
MPRSSTRTAELSRIHFQPAHPGSRAVFIVEARSRKEMRQVRELFDMVGQLAEVVPVSHGTVMSYAVQVHGDASLFGKVEWLLKTQFTFSVVERSFSEVTFRLIRSLCEESETRMDELPECGICATPDPFPTRAILEFNGSSEPVHRAYCASCSAAHAEVEPGAFIQSLLQRDRQRFHVPAGVTVTMLPEMVEERPEWDAGALAIAS